jgi:hypothetical protein
VQTNPQITNPDAGLLAEQAIRDSLERLRDSPKARAFKKLVMAALGSIPWVGGLIQAAAEFHDEEKGQVRINELYREWLEEHTERLNQLHTTLLELIQRLNQFGDDIADRVASELYLALVRQAFAAWDKAATEEKRDLLRKLLANAAGSKLCPDDLVRLFIEWIDKYHEAHFKVIRAIYNNPGVTRADIWQLIHGPFPREDSAEADLFKLLIHDLSLGHVIRQARATTEDGQFFKKPRGGRRITASPLMKTAFDDSDPYVLTQLGGWFVSYTMNELVPRLGEASTSPPA